MSIRWKDNNDIVVAVAADKIPITKDSDGVDYYVTLTELVAFIESGSLDLSGIATNRLLLPLNDDASTPTIAFGDGDSGFYESTDNRINMAIGGSREWSFTSVWLGSDKGGRPRLLNEDVTATNPTLIPNSSNEDTGIGSGVADTLNLIAGGTNVVEVITTGAKVTGNLGMGTSTFGTSAATVLGIINGTAPTSSPADMVQIYAKDVTASSELFVRDEAGTETQLSPHAADAPAWMYDEGNLPDQISKDVNYYTGHVRYINNTRKTKLVQMLIAGEQMPIGDAAQFVCEESFEDHNIRTGNSIVKEDWHVNQTFIYDERETAIIKWENDKAAFELAYTEWGTAVVEYEALLKAWQELSDEEKLTISMPVFNDTEPVFDVIKPTEYKKKDPPATIAHLINP